MKNYKKKVKMIVAVDEQWNIGYNNELLFEVPEDLMNFKLLTKNTCVIMGPNTFDSIGKALPNRLNIILSKSGQQRERCLTMKSVKEIMWYIQSFTTDVYVIGGQQVYESFLPFAEEINLTKILATAEQADTKFINMDLERLWYIEDESPVYTSSTNLNYKFITYRNHNEQMIYKTQFDRY